MPSPLSQKGTVNAMKPEQMSREELLKVVKKLPLTADGVPIVPGMKLWSVASWGDGVVSEKNFDFISPDARRGFKSNWYSTKRAASAAFLREVKSDAKGKRDA